MRAFFKHYIEALIFLLQLPASLRRLKNIQNQNSLLRANMSSDIERWAINKELSKDWNERTAILGGFAKDNARIIEFGAGAMFLKKYLKNYHSYTGSDIVARFSDTVVCDLNKEVSISLAEYDTAIFSGVLEYVYDIEAVVQQLSPYIDHLILSYCCSDIMPVSRDKNGWLSDLTRSELENIFISNGYRIDEYMEWNMQSIFSLIKKEQE